MARAAVGLFSPSHAVVAPSQNRDGYPAWERPLEEQAVQTLMSNTLGNTFYADAKQMLAEATDVHDRMLKKDPKFFADALVYARQKGYMRTQPIYGLVKLASVDAEAFAKVFNRVILTPNDLADFTAIVASQRKGHSTVRPEAGSQGGRAIKQAAGKWLVEKLGAIREDGEADGQYWTIKYGAEKADGAFSLKDMIQIYHPDAKGKKLPLFDYALGGVRVKGKKGERSMDGLNFGKLPQIEQYELLKKATDEDEKVQAIGLGRLPHEVATAFAGSSKKVWNAIVPNMPIFALLRNLATLERHGVLEDNKKLIQAVFTDKEKVTKSKVLPFRFMEAAKHVNATWAQDALRDALELSFSNVLDIDGKTVVALDISGSMGQFIQTAAVFAVSVMKKAAGEGRMFLFDDQLEEFKVSMRDSILTQANKVRVRGGTNHSLVMTRLIQEKMKVDNLIYVTDEQQNTGTPLFKLIEQYRQKVNKHVKVFILDVSPYKNALTPPDANTFYLYGWSDQALQFISMSSQGWGSQVNAIKQGLV